MRRRNGLDIGASISTGHGAIRISRGRVVMDRAMMSCIPSRSCRAGFRSVGGYIFSTYEKMMRVIDAGIVEFREDHSEPPIRKAHIRPIAYELEVSDDSMKLRVPMTMTRWLPKCVEAISISSPKFQ